MLMTVAELLEVTWMTTHKETCSEIRNPHITKLNDTCWTMLAEIGNSYTDQWGMGRFEAESPNGPWIEKVPFNIQTKHYWATSTNPAQMISLGGDFYISVGITGGSKVDACLSGNPQLCIVGTKGNRQRWMYVGMTNDQANYYGDRYEIGQPTPLIADKMLWVIYQVRHSAFDPWQLKITSFQVCEIINSIQEELRHDYKNSDEKGGE